MKFREQWMNHNDIAIKECYYLFFFDIPPTYVTFAQQLLFISLSKRSPYL